MSTETAFDLPESLALVCEAAEKWQQYVESQTGTRPAYRHAIPVVRDFLDELTNAPNQGPPVITHAGDPASDASLIDGRPACSAEVAQARRVRDAERTRGRS